MEILKQTLTWHDGKEPSECGDKLLLCKEKDKVITRATDLPLRDGKYAWHDVIAWAYVNVGEVETAFANMNIDKGWLVFLYNNAIK